MRQEPEEVILDVDATEIEAEKQEAQWTYHKVKGYMPMLGYVNGVCVGQEFREGNHSPSAGILEFAQECEGVLAQANTRIDVSSSYRTSPWAAWRINSCRVG